MNKNGKSNGSLADPSQIKALHPRDESLIQVVIETPKGSRNKYAFDKEQKIFELKKVCQQEWLFLTISVSSREL